MNKTAQSRLAKAVGNPALSSYVSGDDASLNLSAKAAVMLNRIADDRVGASRAEAGASVRAGHALSALAETERYLTEHIALLGKRKAPLAVRLRSQVRIGLSSLSNGTR